MFKKLIRFDKYVNYVKNLKRGDDYLSYIRKLTIASKLMNDDEKSIAFKSLSNIDRINIDEYFSKWKNTIFGLIKVIIFGPPTVVIIITIFLVWFLRSF